MARDEIRGRRKKAEERGEEFRGPTGVAMTEERRRDRESATGRAGGTGRFISPEEEEVPKKTPGTDRDKKQLGDEEIE
jgi:hypothetical protein